MLEKHLTNEATVNKQRGQVCCCVTQFIEPNETKPTHFQPGSHLGCPRNPGGLDCGPWARGLDASALTFVSRHRSSENLTSVWFLQRCSQMGPDHCCPNRRRGWSSARGKLREGLCPAFPSRTKCIRELAILAGALCEVDVARCWAQISRQALSHGYEMMEIQFLGRILMFLPSWKMCDLQIKVQFHYTHSIQVHLSPLKL